LTIVCDVAMLPPEIDFADSISQNPVCLYLLR